MIEYADDRPWPGSSGWSDAVSRSALDAIIGAVEHLTGYEIACINVVYRGALRTVAVRGDQQVRDILMDSEMPVAAMEEALRIGDELGRFVFIPAERHWAARDYCLTVEVGDLDDPAAADDAYQAEDLLSAPIRADDGRMLALLSVDVPVNRRRPDAAVVERLNRYAELVDTAVRMALDHDEQRERIRMARAARRVVAAVGHGLSMEVIFEKSAQALMTGFDAVGVWLQTFDLEHPFSAVHSRTGVVHPVPDAMLPLAERVARREWDRQRVVVLSPRRSARITASESEDEWHERDVARVLAFLDAVDIGSLLLVPVGAGAECLGCLALTRPRSGRRWTTVETETARDIGLDLGRAIVNARAYEREQRAVHQLQALNTYKSQLVATLSHELKTPLASILGNLELLEGGGLSVADNQRGLSALGRGANRLVRVVDDLMLLAKVDDPTNELITRPVDLVDTAADVLDLLAPAAQQRGVELDLVAGPGPISTLGDSAELDRVVTNLVSNALKYTPPGGRVELRVEQHPAEVIVSCTDTGIGISDGDRAQLFREFFRSPDPAAQAQAGTGLGLAIVERIVRRHHGRIEVESTVGLGSTFRVVLPLLSHDGRPLEGTPQAGPDPREATRG